MGGIGFLLHLNELIIQKMGVFTVYKVNPLNYFSLLFKLLSLQSYDWSQFVNTFLNYKNQKT